MKHLPVLITALLSLFARETVLAQAFTNGPSSDSIGGQQSFLWFAGHWSTTKKNTFVIDSTTSGGATGTVTVSPGGNITVSNSSISEWNKRIDDAIKGIDETENKFMSLPAQINEIARNINKVLKPQLDSLKAFGQNMKIDPGQSPLDASSNATQKGAEAVSNIKSFCENFRPRYEEIISFYEAHRHDKDDQLQNPPPPEFNFDCYSCDSSLRKYYDRKVAIYSADFAKLESDMIADILSTDRTMLLIGVWGDPFHGGPASGVPQEMSSANDLFHVNKKDPSQSGACAYLDPGKLQGALEFLVTRLRRRAFKLLRDNRHNYNALMAVCRTYLAVERQAQLLGYPEGSDLQELVPMISGLEEEYQNKLFRDHDWSQLGNIPWILGLVRQKALLGATVDDSEMEKLFHLLGQFRLTIDMDIKVGGNGKYVLAHVKGQSKVTPDFDQDHNQCFRWVLAGDETGLFGVPRKSATQEMKVTVLANEMVTGGPHPVYVGTKTYLTMLKQLRLNFCDPGKDTIILTTFRSDPAMGGMWQVPNSPNIPMDLNALDQYFKSADEMQADVNSGATQAAAAEQVKESEQAMKEAKALQAQMKKNGGRIDAETIERAQQLSNKFVQSGSNYGMAQVLALDFPLEIQNKNVVLVKKVVDAKERLHQAAEAIIYGYYRITLEFVP